MPIAVLPHILGTCRPIRREPRAQQRFTLPGFMVLIASSLDRLALERARYTTPNCTAACQVTTLSALFVHAAMDRSKTNVIAKAHRALSNLALDVIPLRQVGRHRMSWRRLARRSWQHAGTDAATSPRGRQLNLFTLPSQSMSSAATLIEAREKGKLAVDWRYAWSQCTVTGSHAADTSVAVLLV